MGCVSSNLLNQNEDFPQIGGNSSAFGHHIVKLTSTTYGLLTLDPPPPSPPMSPPEKLTIKSEPEIINSWELMSGLDGESFRFTPLPNTPVKYKIFGSENKENSNPNRRSPKKSEALKPNDLKLGEKFEKICPLGEDKIFGSENKENSNPNLRNPKKMEALKPKDLKLGEKFEKICPSGEDKIFGSENKENSNPRKSEALKPKDLKLIEKFEKICPPGGENRVVIYTTSLRGIRQTFEACNAVKAAIESFSIVICERDVSMDRGFRDELMSLMEKRVRGNDGVVVALPPQVFVKGRYIGGAEEVLKLVEEGSFGELICGIPRGIEGGGACDGCGGLFFLPCFRCNGSCKMVKGWGSASVVVRCNECNENGLVPCPICS